MRQIPLIRNQFKAYKYSNDTKLVIDAGIEPYSIFPLKLLCLWVINWLYNDFNPFISTKTSGKTRFPALFLEDQSLQLINFLITFQ